MEPIVDLQLALEHGLSENEYRRIIEILGRAPSYTELGIYSVMWSEHCSYKNSIAELKKLPRTGVRLLVGAGEENAGLVDIGDGLAVAFKIESHNHPSAVEPYQGAATGVGGIMRDIFTMGARPIAALNSLRFGNIVNSQTKRLIKGVVKGIGDYGNSFGVPTVAGDVFFDESYQENPLVNAMAVGIVKHNEIAKAIAQGDGNIVLIVGSATGRDGIHGATFASEEISEESESKRPSVQVGDPFTEKLLLEATLEVIRNKLVVGIQDMGAAGITCSTAEMSAKGNSGMEIILDQVPVREKNMSGYEIMLSESQERMLIVAEPQNVIPVQNIFKKWDLHCSVIGKVTDEPRLKIKYKNKLIADFPPDSLVLGGGAPVYNRESCIPDYIDKVRSFNPDDIPIPRDFTSCFLEILSSPNICSRKWITTQYDSMVRSNTVSNVFGDAAVIRLQGTHKALAVKTDCNPRYVYLNPFIGAQIAVAESARNVVCMGAKPVAITNCLNFGNPYKPEIFWQFKETIRGISEACKILNTPVTGGNVSFYNENPDGAIFPTPVIGMLGEISDIKNCISGSFKEAGDDIILLGQTNGHIGGSEYLKKVHGLISGDAPPINLANEKNLQTIILELIDKRLFRSAHDISDGGLAIALAECCIFDREKCFGVVVNFQTKLRPDFYLFGEDQSRVIVSSEPKNSSEVLSICSGNGISAEIIGKVTKTDFKIGNVIECSVDQIKEIYYQSLEKLIYQ